MNEQRLLDLADLMDKTPQERFDLSRWAKEDECGFVCCAVGTAALNEQFIKQGLTLKRYPKYGFTVSFEELTSFEAVERFFGITEAQADSLFMASSYLIEERNPQSVAKRIREFVNNKGVLSDGEA